MTFLRLISLAAILALFGSGNLYADKHRLIDVASKAIDEKRYDVALRVLPKIKGEDRSTALLYLAAMHRNGWGVEKDAAKSASFRKKATEHSYEYAENLLSGRGGVKQDIQKAISTYYSAARLGSRRAKIQLATMYLHGWNVERNETIAMEFLIQVADERKRLRKIYSRALEGEAWAQLLIGKAFAGDTLEISLIRNAASAIKWYTLAMDQGNIEAHYRLGLLYFRGRKPSEEKFDWQHYQKVDQDMHKAVALISLAAEKGSKDAKKALDYFAKEKRRKADEEKAMQQLFALAATILRNLPNTTQSQQEYKDWERKHQSSLNSTYSHAEALLVLP
ncbi:MAG: tetratricopeptide repeat protein [Pseudomonadota bacterium]